MTCDDDDDDDEEELALVDATGGSRSAETESNGATDDDDDDAIRGEGFLRFFDVGTGAGMGEAVDTGESASGD
jgi:hypothetical protein